MKNLTKSVLVLCACVSSFFIGSKWNSKPIPNDSYIPISDIAIAYDIDGYLTLQLKDVGNVNDNLQGRTYASIKEEINKGFKSVEETENGILFTYDDGTGFYIEK